MLTKLRLLFSITIVFLSFSGFAQSNYWQQKTAKSNIENKVFKRFKVKKGKSFSFNEANFRSILKEKSFSNKSSKTVYFPNENGEQNAYLVKEYPVLSPGLSKKYPNTKD